MVNESFEQSETDACAAHGRSRVSSRWNDQNSLTTIISRTVSQSSQFLASWNSFRSREDSRISWSRKVYPPSGSFRDEVDDPNWRPIFRLVLPLWRLRLWQGPWPIFPTFRSTSNESVELTSPDELLDLVSELNALLRVVAMVTMVKTEFVRVALPGVCAHPFRPQQLLLDLHQYLDFRCIERGVAVKSSRGRAPPNSAVRASLPTGPGRSLDTLVSGGSSRM